MRRSLFASTLFLSACATAPQQQPTVQPPAPVTPAQREVGDLIGLTANELVGRLGRPALQVPEGQSLKIQFRARRCVLDAYLYPRAGETAFRVTHVDARTIAGNDIAQADCMAELQSES
jgi:hypothetical protein